MQNPKKWLTRAGVLLFLLGFFLPCITVSCSGMPGDALSLYDLASMPSQVLSFGQFMLYLALIGMLAVIVFSFLPAVNEQQEKTFFWAQAGSLTGSVVFLCLPLLLLQSQVNRANSGLGMIQIHAEAGAFVVFLGVAAAVGGLVWQATESGVAPLARVPLQWGHADPQPAAPAQVWGNVAAYPPQPAAFQMPQPLFTSVYLEVIEGDLSQRVIPVTSGDFHIGRGSDNDWRISDSSVSRLHLRLRFAEGTWFLQDQQSSSGTYVNGQPVQATRVHTGDEIRIGGTSFVFRDRG